MPPLFLELEEDLTTREIAPQEGKYLDITAIKLQPSEQTKMKEQTYLRTRSTDDAEIFYNSWMEDIEHASSKTTKNFVHKSNNEFIKHHEIIRLMWAQKKLFKISKSPTTLKETLLRKLTEKCKGRLSFLEELLNEYIEEDHSSLILKKIIKIIDKRKKRRIRILQCTHIQQCVGRIQEWGNDLKKLNNHIRRDTKKRTALPAKFNQKTYNKPQNVSYIFNTLWEPIYQTKNINAPSHEQIAELLGPQSTEQMPPITLTKEDLKKILQKMKKKNPLATRSFLSRPFKMPRPKS